VELLLGHDESCVYWRRAGPTGLASPSPSGTS
jgi:hypothetical protein